MDKIGEISAFTCPSCNGALWELQEGNLTRYRCHTGHAFSAESLLAEQSESIEDVLFAGLRALEEKAGLMRRLGERMAGSLPDRLTHYEKEAQQADESCEVLRKLLSRTSAN